MKNSKKKNIYIYLILLIIPFLLVACSSSKGLSKDEIAIAVTENQENIEVYNIHINLDTTIKDLSTDTPSQENTTFSDITINEDSMDSFGEIDSKSLDVELIQLHYSIGNQAYMKLNDEKWQDLSSKQEDYFHHTDSFYTNLTPIVDVLSKMGDLEETKDEYILTFSGESADVYHAFQKPYNVQFGTVEPKDVHQDVVVLIDKDTLFLNSVENTMSAEISGQALEIYIKQEYIEINHDVDFEIPEEIINEANAL